MKKFLTVLLVGGLMAGSIFAFNANAPRVNQDPNAAPIYQNYQGTRGGYMFNEENMITVTGTIDSIEENKDFPGMLEIKIKTDNGDFVEIHANSYFAKDLEVGKNIEVKGWEIEFNNEKIFRPVESKVDGKDVVLNGFRGAARGMGVNTQLPGYTPKAPVANQGFRGRNMNQAPRGRYMNQVPNGNYNFGPRGNYQMQNNCYGPQTPNGNFAPRGNFQMPGYQGQQQYPNQQPMPRGRW
ncbi:hypothetical protein [Marinitoga aeolica]|uniref:Anti-sigma factor domain-containing protein n=1 Tax=Marinitoga aeolica TaxID=2809031 RepID=A0ABY8PTD6_9BACT|nr:hypothetical protein [Marinitoga aeolica]WGS65896.1 anti-sigma factor domain-containing protein [Marinitoga aeolica]